MEKNAKSKHGKSITRSKLDAIEGIGAGRKKALLNYFGSAEAVAQASLKDIENVTGISKKTAEKVFKYFHK